MKRIYVLVVLVSLLGQAAEAVTYRSLTLDIPANPGWPAWSRDGTDRIAYSGGYWEYIVPANGGPVVQVTRGPCAGILQDHPSWSPDGSSLAFHHVYGGVVICPAADYGDSTYILLGGGSSVSWSPVGNELLFGEGVGSDLYMAIAPATVGGYSMRRRVGSNPIGEWQFRWSPDGSRIVYVYQGRLWIEPVDGSWPAVDISPFDPYPPGSPAGAFSTPDWSPDGKWVLYVYTYVMWGAGHSELGCTSVPRGKNVILRTFEENDQHSIGGGPVWSADGRSIACVGEGALWILSDLGLENVTAVPPLSTSSPEPLVNAFPNPFNPSTTLSFDLPGSASVKLSIYDVGGRLLRTIVDGPYPVGSHEAVWDGRDATGRCLASGSYFARLQVGGKAQTVRMSLIR